MRLVITGAPRAGKTTHAATIANTVVLHTDDLIADHDWSDASAEVARKWFKRPGPWVIEGVAAVRALRKFMLTSHAKPCDAVLYLARPYTRLNAGQASMAKGVDKVWREIVPRLRVRGVAVYESIEEMQKGTVRT